MIVSQNTAVLQVFNVKGRLSVCSSKTASLDTDSFSIHVHVSSISLHEILIQSYLICIVRTGCVVDTVTVFLD